MRRVRQWLVPVALVVALPAAGSAQDPTDEPLWTGAVYYTALEVSPAPDRAFWQTVTISARRRLAAGSLALEGVATRRFDAIDQAIAADAYHDLYPGAYAHLRLQLAPGAEVLPRVDLTGELFQAVGSAEVVGSYRHQSFEEVDVSTFGLGVGYYVGSWYLRQRSLVAHIDQNWSPFFMGAARRYLDDAAEDYVEVSAGGGEEVMEADPTAGAGVDVITSGARFVAVTGKRFVVERIGVLAGVSYSGYDRIPDRWGLSLGVIVRWGTVPRLR